jgi:regulator of nucleoside diphosphate kinase
MARSSHRARTVMDATTLERLEALAGAIVARMLEAGYLLVNKLTSAKVLPPGRLPGDVITIGRQVLYCHAYASRDVRVTLSWLEPTCLGQGRVLVPSSIAAVLLGLSGGSWSSERTGPGSSVISGFWRLRQRLKHPQPGSAKHRTCVAIPFGGQDNAPAPSGLLLKRWCRHLPTAAGRCPFCRVEFKQGNSRLLIERHLTASTDGGGIGKSHRRARRNSRELP